MNKTIVLALSALLVSAASTFAQSPWQTVDDFQTAPGKGAAVAGMAAAGNGIVFSACMVDDPAGQRHGVIRRSLDGGANWLNVFDVPNTAFANCWSVTVGPSGRVFATGSAWPAGITFSKNWLTFRSLDGGDSWEIVDSTLASGPTGNPYAVIEDALGRVFVGGVMENAQGGNNFVIRRSLDGGASWTTVDNLPGSISGVFGMTATPSGVFAVGRLSNSWIVRRSTNGGNTWTTVDQLGGNTYAYGVTSDTSGNLYVIGAASISVKRTTTLHWIVRKSSNGGATWQTVDDYWSSASHTGRAITADAYGRIFASGQVSSGSASRWLTRVSVNGGATWTTTDDYTGALGQNMLPRGSASDAVGNVFVGGQANGSDGVAHATVRKLSAP